MVLVALPTPTEVEDLTLCSGPETVTLSVERDGTQDQPLGTQS